MVKLAKQITLAKENCLNDKKSIFIFFFYLIFLTILMHQLKIKLLIILKK